VPVNAMILRKSVLVKLLAGDDVQTGDAHFDGEASLHGPEAGLLAAMDEAARLRVLQLLARNGQVHERVVVLVDSGMERDPYKLCDTARLLIGVAGDLVRGFGDAPAGLARNAALERSEPVRLRNLEALLAHHGASDAARGAIEAGLRDGAASVRLLSARAATREQRSAALEALLAIAANPLPALAEQLASTLGRFDDPRLEQALLPS
jgi:hypothetical protein